MSVTSQVTKLSKEVNALKVAMAGVAPTMATSAPAPVVDLKPTTDRVDACEKTLADIVAKLTSLEAGVNKVVNQLDAKINTVNEQFEEMKKGHAKLCPGMDGSKVTETETETVHASSGEASASSKSKNKAKKAEQGSF
jgi:uncharacterized phage infection (PIP) family protein YhgE